MNNFILLIFTNTLSASIFLFPVQAKNFAWGCRGPMSIGHGLRIVETQKPGSEIVRIMDSSHKVVIEFYAQGPMTEEVLPGVGRDGEDEIVRKRTYVDGNGAQWIYKNRDAHPIFQSTENSELNISCFP